MSSEFTVNSFHVGMIYMAYSYSPKAPGHFYAATPRDAAKAFFAKYPKSRTPINVRLVHEYKNGEETMIRYWDNWRNWDKVSKADFETILPWGPFDNTYLDMTFKTEGIMLFHSPKSE
jgi:hypothetical protein